MSRIPESEWVWYGYAGHFIGGRHCAYHLSTRIGDYLISTVGDYRPPSLGGERERLGAGKNDYYETHIFPCDGETKDGDPNVTEWCEVDGTRYPESIDAERGHRDYCEKYANTLEGKDE